MAAAYLTISDLYDLVGSQKVLQYFDDDFSGSIDGDETAIVTQILTSAEDFAYSRMRRAYPDAATITLLAQNDTFFLSQVAWVALEFASERRSEFANEDGKGAYWAQYERAKSYFDSLSKGNIRSIGEETVGVGANTGGVVQPTRTSDEANFTFAPDTKYPTGHGGF